MTEKLQRCSSCLAYCLFFHRASTAKMTAGSTVSVNHARPGGGDISDIVLMGNGGR